MKTLFLQIASVVVLFGLMISVSYGGWLTDEEREEYAASNANLETLRINDDTTDTDDNSKRNPLFRIFNEYFKNELNALYTSGNELADDRMIRYTISSWQVNEGSNVVASFTSANMTHGLEIYSTTGALLYETGQYDSSTSGSAMIDGRPIDLNAGDYIFSVNTDEGMARAFSGDHEWYYSTDEYLANPNNWGMNYYKDGIEHLIAFNVTDLIRQRSGYENIESAFLFAFEDSRLNSTDFDYQDFAFVLTNVQANVITATPEPATILIFGIAGGIALPFLRRKNKKNNNTLQ
jgi:hypothetical protein